MRSISIFVTILISCTTLLGASCKTQKQNYERKCLRVSEGFIVEIIENGSNGDLSTSKDYFFFEKEPTLSPSSTPLTLFSIGGKPISMAHLRALHFEKIMTQGYTEFDSKGKTVNVVKAKEFTIKVFRVLMAYYEEDSSLLNYTSREISSHTYSYLINLSKDKKGNEVVVIFPELIKIW